MNSRIPKAHASVATVINTLTLKGISWPGGSRLYFQFCLGEFSRTDFFYYSQNYHGPMRAKLAR